MDGPRRVTLRVDQNGAEELTPPGQAILVRGMETPRCDALPARRRAGATVSQVARG
jgi:hypothetical protein